MMGVWLLLSTALAFETSEAQHLEIKWVRDSVEYNMLTRQIYRHATEQVQRAAGERRRGQGWVVVLDIDDTTLNTSTYWLERAAYNLRFDWQSWDAWTERRDAPPIEGVTGFVRAVREAGGAVAWITNRHERTREATVDNLRAHGLWNDEDALCMLSANEAYTKEARRQELQEGRGACSLGSAVRVVAYVGDAAGDFPAAATSEETVGVRDFVIPNPMYGDWEHRVTRLP